MKKASTSGVRVRFAPSPTGNLHIGNFRTAIFNWLFARHYSGTFLVRIEDTDTARSKEEYTQGILDALAWAKLTPDEDLFIQSQAIDEHKKIMNQLITQGKAYRCYCSQQEITDRAGDAAFAKYDGHCRNRTDAPDLPFVVRFKLPEFEAITFDDLIRGAVRFERDQLDDFIIARSDGNPIYNFVVVIDDAAMHITHVIRGEDHISNTPKQILLYQACGYSLPQFAHLPMILGPSGDRLSKRDGATSVNEFKEMGYLPEALINYLVRLGWSHGDQEIFSREELIEFFTLDAVGKKGSIFDQEKLKWVNAVYIKAASSQDLFQYLLTNINPELNTIVSPWNNDTILKAIELYKERVATMRELLDDLILLHNGPKSYIGSDLAKWTTHQTKEHLKELVDRLNQLDDFSLDACNALVKDLVKQLGIKFVAIAQPIRIALLGKSSGPGIFEMCEILGKKETIERISRLQEYL